MLRRNVTAVLLLVFCCLALPVAAQAACTASGSWVNNPDLPDQIPSGIGLCPFFQFSWESFLALVEPSGKKTGQLVFETYMSTDGLFVGNGQQPLPWGKSPWPLTLGGVTKQAGSGFDLIAQNGAEVQFDMSVNQPMYNYITQNLLYNQGCFNAGDSNIHMPPASNVAPSADESIELKTAWMPMRPCDPKRYHCTIAKVNGQATQVALIGIHIVQKLPNHEEWIWSTFEHVANAPQCSEVTSPPQGYSGWNFFNSSFVAAGNACTPCPNPEDPTGSESGDTQCNVATQCNVWTSETDEPNICRVADLLDDVSELNSSVWSQLPSNSVWKNYMLVGTLWTAPGLTSPTDPTSQTLAGSTGLSNAVMETYTQNSPDGSTISQGNCFNCHTSTFKADDPTNPEGSGHADFSHIFGRILQTTTVTCPPLTQTSHGDVLAPARPVSSHGSGNKK
ncbi:MAG TPA: hypothetical protein VF414_09615 [Thermoanaerobaculia bacterium]